MQRSTDSKWELPGGRLETKETYKSAAKRELREETGVDMYASKAIFLREREIAHKNAWVGIMYFLALGWSTPEKLQAINPQEIKRVAFCTIADLGNMDLTERSKEELFEDTIARYVL